MRPHRPQQLAPTGDPGLNGAPTGPAAVPARVLFVITTSDVGGTESVVRELVCRLDRRRFTPIVCSLCPPGRIAEQIAAANVTVFTLGMSPTAKLRELLAGPVTLARHIDAYQIDLVNSFLYRANVVAGLATRWSRRRPVLVSGQRCLTQRAAPRAALAARWTRRLADSVIAVSQAVKAELVQLDGVAPERIIVIANGVDAEHYRPTDMPAARRALGLPANAIVVGAAGRLSTEKGYHYLLDSVALARRDGHVLHVAIAGDGPEGERLRAQAHALGITPQVHFLGMVGDLRPVYAAMDIFALTSLEEGAPNALLEAMACSRAVVAHRIGGVPEIIEDGCSGVLVATGMPAAFAAVLARVAGDEALRARLGAAARERVAARFDIHHTVAEHARVFGALLAARRTWRLAPRGAGRAQIDIG